eukprot:Nitzschia sp. Nitz4//scaffold1_size375055//181955//184669//NITZ4_000273-RA/size375055-processed-gene-0.361-mRNA-1//1//CDS//3329541036//7922//frame0
MRARGRRVALVLASVLPLLANPGHLEPAGFPTVPLHQREPNPLLVREPSTAETHSGIKEDSHSDSVKSVLGQPKPQPLHTNNPSDGEEISENVTSTNVTDETEKVSIDDTGGDPEVHTKTTEISNSTTEVEVVSTLSDNETNTTDSALSEELGETNLPTNSSDLDGENSTTLELNATSSATAETLVKSVNASIDADEDNTLARVSVDYASKSAGALIIEKSTSFQGTSNLLNGDKDKYAIAPCEDKRFVVISLSEDILVKQIKLANYERFSSSVKEFQVMGSQTLGTWFDLGTYQAKAGFGEQTFVLYEPAWARYLKLKYLSHHGDEFYCTQSQIQVHGSTMIQGFHEQWEESNKEDNEEDSPSELVGNGSPENLEDGPTKEVEAKSVVAISDNDLSNVSSLMTKKLSGVVSTDDSMPDDSTRETPIRFASVARTQNQHCDSTLGVSPQRISTGRFSKRLPQTGKHTDTNVDYFLAGSKTTMSMPRIATSTGSLGLRCLGTSLGRKQQKTGVPMDEPKWSSPPNMSEDAQEDKKSSDSTNNSDPVVVKVVKEADKVVSRVDDPETTTNSKEPVNQVQDEGRASGGDASGGDPLNLALAKVLDGLPSAKCLALLDFPAFQADILASKKQSTGASTSAAPGAIPKEPIFKKLTDEIKLLQTNVHIHDQFSKSAAACYQTVLLDLIVEMEKIRADHESRLQRLESTVVSSIVSQFWVFAERCGRAYQSLWTNLLDLRQVVYAQVEVAQESWDRLAHTLRIMLDANMKDASLQLESSMKVCRSSMDEWMVFAEHQTETMLRRFPEVKIQLPLFGDETITTTDLAIAVAISTLILVTSILVLGRTRRSKAKSNPRNCSNLPTPTRLGAGGVLPVEDDATVPDLSEESLDSTQKKKLDRVRVTLSTVVTP